LETKDQNDIAALQSIVLESPLLSPILHGWEKIALPDCWLVAGAIAQTVWNHCFGLPATHGITDIDIVYFDAADFSESAEAAHASRIRAAFSPLPAWIDVRNEARVQLWYEARFACSIVRGATVAPRFAPFLDCLIQYRWARRTIAAYAEIVHALSKDFMESGLFQTKTFGKPYLRYEGCYRLRLSWLLERSLEKATLMGSMGDYR